MKNMDVKSVTMNIGQDRSNDIIEESEHMHNDLNLIIPSIEEEAEEDAFAANTLSIEDSGHGRKK